MTWGIWLRRCLNEQQDEFELYWPSLFTSFPVIVRTTRPGSALLTKANGVKTKSS
jgi:dihydroceramidase